MIIYLLELFLGIIICYFIQSKATKEVHKTIWIGALIALLSLVGGFRALNIGTDIGVYGKKYFDLAVAAQSLPEYLKIFSSTEKGYLILNFIVSRFTDNISILFLTLQLLCNTLVILTLYSYRKKCPLWMSFTIYFCFFYGLSFNIMRQSCALAIIFFAIRFLEEKKQWIFYFILILLAYTFHSTALIGGILVFLVYLICKGKSDAKTYIIFITLFGAIFSLICIKDVIPVLYNLGIISERIYNYMFTFLNETIDISVGETIFKLVFMFFAFLPLKKYKDKYEMNYFLIISMIIEFILFQFRIVISYAHRFSFYFGYMGMLLFPQCFEAMTIKIKGKNMNKFIFLALCLSFFIYKFVISGNSQIYPYRFIF